MACLAHGMGRDYPPTDEAGFRAFARGMRSPALADVLEHATLVGSIAAFRTTENRMRNYSEMSRRPEGFVVLGDAACAFNPVYGQGMTMAAIGADLLGTCLQAQLRQHPDGSLRGLAGTFQRKLAAASQMSWMMATGSDHRCRATEGGHAGLITRVLNGYLDKVMAAATIDPEVNRTLVKAMQLAAPPTALFHPRVLLPALRGPARAATAPAPAAALQLVTES
ncbi:MAG TPA: hypothetical protein VM536_13695 [Chloroflexia bacterium]|nr:hypothetical protein [Chloroflexia bacterium]